MVRMCRLLICTILLAVSGCEDWKELHRRDWKLITPQRPAKIIDLPRSIHEIVGFSRDGTRLVVDSTVLDVSTGREVFRLSGDPLLLVNDVLLARNIYGSPEAYDVMTGRKLYRVDLSYVRGATAVGDAAFLAGRNLYDLRAGRKLATFGSEWAAASDDLTLAGYIPEARNGERRAIVLVSLPDGREREAPIPDIAFKAGEEPRRVRPLGLRFSRNGKYLIVRCELQDDQSLHRQTEVVLDAATGRRLLDTLQDVQATASGQAVLSPMPSLVARERIPRPPCVLYTVPDGRVLGEFTAESDIVSCPAGIVAGYALDRRNLISIDEATGRVGPAIRAPQTPNTGWRCRAISPGGGFLLLDSWNGQTAIISTLSGETVAHMALQHISERRRHYAYRSFAQSIAYRADESRVAIAMGSQVLLLDLPPEGKEARKAR